MPHITCLLQGITDRPLQQLGGITPLQKAETPVWDGLVARYGLVETAPVTSEGLQLETALLDLLGVEAGKERLPMAPLEALAAGYTLGPAQWAAGVRLVSIGANRVVDVSDELVSEGEGKVLFQCLNEIELSEPVHFVHLRGGCGIAVGMGGVLKGLAERVVRPVDQVGCDWVAAMGCKSIDGAYGLLQACHDRLASHEINELRDELEERPINGLLCTDGGRRPDWADPALRDPSAAQIRLYTQSPSFAGIAKGLGLSPWTLPMERRRFDHVARLIEELPRVLTATPTVILDIPYLWWSTCKGDLRQKIKTIEWLDRHLLGPLMEVSETSGATMDILTLRHSDVTQRRAVEGPVIKVRVEPTSCVVSGE